MQAGGLAGVLLRSPHVDLAMKAVSHTCVLFVHVDYKQDGNLVHVFTRVARSTPRQ